MKVSEGKTAEASIWRKLEGHVGGGGSQGRQELKQNEQAWERVKRAADSGAFDNVGPMTLARKHQG